MATMSLQKQVSLFLPTNDWLNLRQEAARRGIPITQLCRQWLEPGLADLRPHAESENSHLAITYAPSCVTKGRAAPSRAG